MYIDTFSSGNIDQVIYPRSAMKYIQILPLLESGAVEHYQFTDEEIAVMCASHYSEPHHLAVVRAILSKIGVTEDDLACGGHAPGCEVSMYQYIRCLCNNFEVISPQDLLIYLYWR